MFDLPTSPSLCCISTLMVLLTFGVLGLSHSLIVRHKCGTVALFQSWCQIDSKHCNCRSQGTYWKIPLELTQINTLGTSTQRSSQRLPGIFIDFICFLSKYCFIVFLNISLVKIKREVKKSNFYGAI